jgi:hypothetical protein
MKIVLCIEEPNLKEQQHPWNSDTIKKLRLDSEEVIYLEKGNTLFRDGNTAYSLEEE